MDSMWIQCGFDIRSIQSTYGRTMNLIWFPYVLNMDSLWIQNRFDMDSMSIQHGFHMDPMRIQYGFDMIQDMDSIRIHDMDFNRGSI